METAHELAEGIGRTRRRIEERQRVLVTMRDALRGEDPLSLAVRTLIEECVLQYEMIGTLAERLEDAAL